MFNFSSLIKNFTMQIFLEKGEANAIDFEILHSPVDLRRCPIGQIHDFRGKIRRKPFLEAQ